MPNGVKDNGNWQQLILPADTTIEEAKGMFLSPSDILLQKLGGQLMDFYHKTGH